MIHVLAFVRVKPGQREAFLEVFKANIPEVTKEAGCRQYLPAVDIASGLPVQQVDPHMVTIIETWESVQALQDHLKTPHMLAYREKVKDLVESLTIQVLQPA